MKEYSVKSQNMISLKVIVFLAVCALTQAKHLRVSLESFEQFIGCVKQQMVRGNPAANIPCFSPYHQDHNFEFPWSLSPNLRTQFNVINLNWTGLADFTYKFYEIPNDSHDTSIFTLKIIWKRLTLKGTWVRDRNFYRCTSHDSGLVTIDLYDREWNGTVTLTRNEIVSLVVKPSLKKAKVKFSNVGKQSKILVPFSSHMWYYLLNESPLYAQYLGKYYRDKFTHDWLRQHDRIDIVLKQCRHY